MELFNRHSQNTPVAQPTLRPRPNSARGILPVGPCNGSGFNRDKKTLAANRTPIGLFRSLLRDFPHERIVRKPLLSILGLAILVDIGPVASDACARASLVLIQIFLGLCQLGLTIFQIFGT